MRRAGFGLALTLLAAAPAASETIDVRPELAFQGSAPLQEAVEAHVGDTIRVDLPAQAGTGYEWTSTVQGEVAGAWADRKPPGQRARAGRRGRSWTYLAAAPGTARITFRYHRPWETSKGPARQVVLSIAITEAPVVDPVRAAGSRDRAGHDRRDVARLGAW